MIVHCGVRYSEKALDLQGFFDISVLPVGFGFGTYIGLLINLSRYAQQRVATNSVGQKIFMTLIWVVFSIFIPGLHTAIEKSGYNLWIQMLLKQIVQLSRGVGQGLVTFMASDVSENVASSLQSKKESLIEIETIGPDMTVISLKL